ncbi:Gfo/Idh/MocA family protein [Halosolutus gelatinilyticus]|uniref:Gfo/Idh/MocA family protein n=1 Tax=Halosolutus gelatinilyticus TaxID=2931975 RepID=UPI001FF5A6D5|nr:Gfo/Idh/MocA family oxidoreductase [Halosolutus gelatinilyticus]
MTGASDDLRVGMLSAAHVHADAYASAVRDELGVPLAGVSDDDPDRGREFAERHDTQYRERDDLLEAIDAAIVCSENTTHEEWVAAAADAGVDVLCEKPLATETATAASIVETCERAGVELGVAMPLRFSEPALRARRAYERGRIGSIEYLAGTNRGRMPGGWFTDPDAAGGGAAIDHTVHIVDLVHWLTDERVAEVYAELDTRFHSFDVEDVNVLSMELSDGAVFTLDGSWSRPDKWDFWGDATLDVVGSEGTISVDCFDQKYKLTRDGGDDPGIASVFWGSDPNAGLIRDFADAVQTGRSPEVTGSEAAAAVAVLDAVYESAERRMPVEVEYPDHVA